MSEADFEKLGVFYLGRRFDAQKGKRTDELCLYDSTDLVTHAVCIGMTGSGKTGLCLGLMEEALIDSIPIIAIDPKGDIANLLLTFPKLRGEDFEPWVDADQAKRAGISVSEFAAQQASNWKQGLAQWEQTGDRIARLRDAAEFAIYTPGSSAGIPVSIVQSFSAPPRAILEDDDAFQDRVATAASSLLCLLGIDADPLRSRDHILIANLLQDAWRHGQDLSLQALIQLIQQPPLRQIGAIDLEAFYPAKERFQLSMTLNNLLASPGFDSWLKGEPLDINKLLHTKDGKPRAAIFSIAHLDDTQRMFFTSLLLNQLLSWMRAQSGTSSLRCMFYMDEIFGYFPPTANPPSKKPLLTLMKQARAFGLGVVLATQNPVDIDYKGLSNAGTWFIGRLQTERDKMRVLDGLQGAAADAGAGFDRAAMDRLLSKLGSRVFLMNNVHEHEPTVFETRWTLSYLRGPLTRQQIKLLMQSAVVTSSSPASATSIEHEDHLESRALTVNQPTAGLAPRPQAAHATNGTDSAAAATAFVGAATISGGTKPLLSPDIHEYFLPITQPMPEGTTLLYKPRVIAVGNVRFADTKSKVDSTLQYTILAKGPAPGMPSIDWQTSEPAKVYMEQLVTSPQGEASFEPLEKGMSDSKTYSAWSKEFAGWLYNNKRLKIFHSDLTGDFSKPRESERDFRIRLTQVAREQRDQAAADLKARYAPKLNALEQKVRKAEQEVEKQQAQARDEQMQSAISVGATVLGAFMGRKRIGVGTIERATRAAKRMGKASQEQMDVEHAQESASALSAQLASLNAEFAAEMSSLDGKFDPLKTALTTLDIAPKKTNITIALIGLAWAPFFRDKSGVEIPGWRT